MNHRIIRLELHYSNTDGKLMVTNASDNVE